MIPDRTKAPDAQEIALPLIPAIQELQLPNGVTCNVLNQGDQPVVLFEVIFPVGRLNEPVPGISYYLAKMLTEGTNDHNSEQIASIFDFYGSHLEIIPTLDTINIKLYSLARFFPELASVLLELVSDSIYPENEFEVVKKIRVQQILQQQAKNNTFAGLLFREKLFGIDHPYGEIITEEKAQKIGIEEVRSFSQALKVKPEIFIAGKIGEEEIKTVTDTFGAVPFDYQLKTSSHDMVIGVSEGITREDSTQASIKFGNHTITRNHDDIHKLKIANSLFGGFFGSRLMKNIREEKGLTYGIHSSLIHLQEASYWQVSTEVLRDKVELAMEEIVKEIKRLQQTPPSEVELDTAINYMKGKLLTAFDTPFNAINTIKSIKLAGLKMDYFTQYQSTLQTVRPAQISEVAEKYFNVNESISVVVK